MKIVIFLLIFLYTLQIFADFNQIIAQLEKLKSSINNAPNPFSNQISIIENALNLMNTYPYLKEEKCLCLDQVKCILSPIGRIFLTNPITVCSRKINTELEKSITLLQTEIKHIKNSQNDDIFPLDSLFDENSDSK